MPHERTFLQLTKSTRRSVAHGECKSRQLTESAEYREGLYQKQCSVDKCRGREIAGAKLENTFLVRSRLYIYNIWLI